MHGIFWVRVAKSFYAPIKLLFPSVEAAWTSSMLSIGGTVIPDIIGALALCIAVPRSSTNRFFNCVFLRYTVFLTVIIIIMNWFQATQGGEPALLQVAHGVIGFVAVHCLWNEVKQLMGKVWDWNKYGIKLSQFDGMVLHTGNEDGGRGDDDATALLEDHGGCPEDEDRVVSHAPRAVQVLSICANFPISVINGYDDEKGCCLYLKHKDMQHEGEVQENGMADLVLIGPRSTLLAYTPFILQVFYYTTAGDKVSIEVGWDVDKDDEVEEHIETICPGPGRELEITFLVIPISIEAYVEATLTLKDIDSVSRAVYGKIKASAGCYGNKSVHLFSCERERSLFFPSGSTSILPLSPDQIALQRCQQPELYIEVDLTVITTCASQEDKNLKFTLQFTPQINCQEREVDGDQVEVSIIWNFHETRYKRGKSVM